jgi:hypothetical protein
MRMSTLVNARTPIAKSRVRSDPECQQSPSRADEIELFVLALRGLQIAVEPSVVTGAPSS